ncbi:MAG: NAD-dependent epimerase/dehydratase family protein [Vulcanimicrobiota bacterium]
MNILVTGGAGFIGSNIADLLLSHGHDIIVIDDLSSGKKENIASQAIFYHKKIGEDSVEEVFRKHRIDMIAHLAAQIDVRKSVADPVFDAQTNILDGIRLLQLCVKYGVKKIIYSSTGGAIYGEPEYIPADENHPVRPQAPYGVSKFGLEKYIEYFSDMYNLDYTVLRYANVYGPRQDPHGEAGVVAIFSGKLLRNEDCLIFGDGNQTRDFVFIEDVARANLSALEKGNGKTVNIGTGVETSVNQLYGMMAEITHSNKKPVYKQARPGEVQRIALTSEKAKEILGWEPRVDIKTGLMKTINFFKIKKNS